MANNPNRLAGIAYLTVNGQNFMLAGDLSYGVASVSRETKVGQDKVHGFGEKPVPGFIAGTIRDSGGLSVAQINAMDNVTVVAELANGKTITGSSMWTVEAQEVKTDEATLEVRWEGFNVQEV